MKKFLMVALAFCTTAEVNAGVDFTRLNCGERALGGSNRATLVANLERIQLTTSDSAVLDLVSPSIGRAARNGYDRVDSKLTIPVSACAKTSDPWTFTCEYASLAPLKISARVGSAFDPAPTVDFYTANVDHVSIVSKRGPSGATLDLSITLTPSSGAKPLVIRLLDQKLKSYAIESGNFVDCTIAGTPVVQPIIED